MNAQKISHRLLSALVAVCLLLTFSLPSAAAQENAPAVTVSSTSGVPGQQVQISMDTENLSPAIGLSIKFSFDSSQISCVDVKLDPGLEAEGKDVILLHSPNTGLITFAFVASDKVPYSFGHLFTATFEIKDGAQTTSITPKVEVYRNESNEELSSSVKVSSGEITVMDIPVAGISLDRHELNMLTGGTDTLVATISPDNATDKSVSWASSDPGVVSVDQEGNLSALKPGNATITATAANGLSDSCAVTVADPDIPVAGISLDRHELSMVTGGTDTLVATISPDDATDKSVSWASSDPSVVSVDQEGNLSALKPGNATITATAANGLSDSCAVTVADPDIPVAGISLDRHELSMVTGGTDTLVATISPDDATDKSVSWASSDPSVVSVDQEGNLSALKPGNATITATAANGLSDSCAVTVADPDIPVAGISLDRHELSLLTGGTDTLVATISPDNATDKSVSWTSSDPGVVSVDQEGNLSALKPGNATITATAANGLSDSCAVTVADPDIPVAGISLDRHELSLLTGGTDTLVATITPDDATEEILWTSSDESIVTVDQNGNLKAVAPGKATVTAGTASGISDSCLVTVSDPGPSDVPVESIAVDPDKTIVKVGECKQLNVTISPENATDQTVTWSSSDKSIVTVDENGKITGVKPGTATITVTTANGLTATCTVTVTAAGSNPDDKPGGSTGEDGGKGPQTGDSTSSSALLAGTIALAVSIAVLKKRRSA